MAKDEAAGQYLNTLLRVIGALVSGEMIELKGFDDGIEVIAVARDNWPGSPVMVTIATMDGHRPVRLDEIEFV